MKETKAYAQAPKPAPSLPPKASAPVRSAAPAPAPVVTPKPGAAVPKPAPVKAEAAPPAAKPVVKPPVPEAAKVAKAAPAKAPETPKVRPPASPAPVRPATHLAPVYLSSAELQDNPIEVRNGTWTPNLAHEVRSLLNLEGFTVAIIGNHIDFGVEKTIIFYQPGAAKVAQALRANIFRTASLEETAKLKDRVAVKVLLGRDLLEQADLMARLGEGEAPPLPAAKQPPKPDKPLAAPAPVERPVPAKQASPAAPPQKVAPPDPLTAAELMDTPIEVRNGTWTPNLAHQVRSLLNLEGFTVAIIGNHIDFGAAKTIIFYRPGTEKVARTLASKFFPGATLESSEKLRKDVGVKILLGADLLQSPDLMARLAAEGKE